MFRSSRYRRNRQPAEEVGPEQHRRAKRQPAISRVAAASFVLLGLVLGLVGGLAYAWLLSPVVYVDAQPARLSDRYKDEYILLVSQTYAATGDWQQAQERLAALEDPDLPQRAAALLERSLREAEPAATVRNLARLTERLGGQTPALALFSSTPLPPPITPTATTAASTATATLLPTPTFTRPPTNTPIPSSTPTATPLPTATARPIYRLLSQERLCDPEAPSPLIAVEVVDAQLEPLPGVEMVVGWDGGSDRFFTGFQPDQGPGYGDFTMQPGVSYSIAVAGGSDTISGLRVEPCPEAEGGFPGGWLLTFQNLIENEPTPTATPSGR